MTTLTIGLFLAALLAAGGAVQWKWQNRLHQKEKYILDYAGKVSEMEEQEREEERLRLEEEARKQRERVFGMDFLITHGSAFGGCAATCADGRLRRGTVPLDNILLYGRQPSGREFTYYIEEQGLEICATDREDELLVRSGQQPFEIREAGLARSQGISEREAILKRDVTYYIILESKHEISIKATKRC